MVVNSSDIISHNEFIKEFKKDNFVVIRDSPCELYLEQSILNECFDEVGEIIKYVNIDNKLYELVIDYQNIYQDFIITNVKSTLITNYFNKKNDIVQNWSIEIECNENKINEIKNILKQYNIKVKLI